MGAVALSQGAGLVIAAVGALVLAVAAAYLVSKGGWSTPPHEREPKVPATLSPGPADADLDTTILERYQGWGLVLVLFFVIWIPLYWLAQPTANLDAQERLKTDSVARGHEITLEANEAVNPGGVGCATCHGQELGGGETLFQGKPYAAPPLNNVCDVSAHPAIKSKDDLVSVIAEGRANTPMPAWSVLYGGAMTDQQIDDVVNYLISINMETVPPDKNTCINEKAGSPTPEPSGSPAAGGDTSSPAADAGTTPSPEPAESPSA